MVSLHFNSAEHLSYVEGDHKKYYVIFLKHIAGFPLYPDRKAHKILLTLGLCDSPLGRFRAQVFSLGCHHVYRALLPELWT